jgi:hypothetical protein
MLIDYGYAANLEELQNVVENLTDAVLADYRERVKDRHFDPSIVQFNTSQLRLAAEVRLLEDGSPVYDLRIDFLSAREAANEQR